MLNNWVLSCFHTGRVKKVGNLLGAFYYYGWPVDESNSNKISAAIPIHSTSIALFEGSHTTLIHILDLLHQMMSEEASRTEPWAVLDSKAGDGISLISHCCVLAPAFCCELHSGSTRNLSTEVDTISLKFIHIFIFLLCFPFSFDLISNRFLSARDLLLELSAKHGFYFLLLWISSSHMKKYVLLTGAYYDRK